MVEEGNTNQDTLHDTNQETNHDDDNLPNLMDQDDYHSVDSPECKEDDETFDLEQPSPEPEPDTPLIVDSSAGP
jgi:hypothetical protein